MAGNDRFEAMGESAADLRDTLESAWDEGAASAVERQVSADTLAAEIDRRDPSDRELLESAWDAGEARGKAREDGAEPEREARPEYADPQDRRGVRKALLDEYDKAAAPDADPDAKPADDAKADTAKPEAKAPETPAADTRPDAPAWSDADRAALDKMTPDARQWAEGKATEFRAAYAGVDALAARHGDYLASIGADTPDRQINALDNLLQTERALRTGTPEQRAAIMGALARQYGVGPPATAAAPAALPSPTAGQPPASAHPLQAAALASPHALAQATPAPADSNDLRGTLESDWQAQQDAAAARATPEGQAVAQREREADAVKQMETFAGEKDEFGHPRHALFDAVMPEMIEAAAMLRQHGRTPDLPTVYKAAVQYAAQTRPDEIVPLATADGRTRLQAFQARHPVANDPRLLDRMNALAIADARAGEAVDPKSLMDRALKLEPEIAARQERHVADEKALGFKTPRPSLRQLLEAGWDAQAA